MAGLIKRRGIYYAQFRSPDHAGVRRVSLRTRSKAEARRRLSKLEAGLQKGEWCPWAGLRPQREDATVRDAIYTFLFEKEIQHRSPNTIRTYKEVLGLFQSLVSGSRLVRSVTLSELNQFVYASHLSGSTRYKRYGHLRAFFRWCARQGMSDADEFTQVEAPRRPSKIPRFVTEEELDLICAAIESDYQEERSRGVVQEGSRIWVIPLFRLAFVTGMRAGELARLRWNDIDFEEGLIYIKVQKNRREQTIPLTSAARSILESVERGASDDHVFSAPGNYRQERNVHEWVNRLGAAFRAARVLAGIDRRITVHGLRHGFCTTLAQRGKSAFVIMAAARHSDISTTARYVEYANRHLAKELEEVFSIR